MSLSSYLASKYLTAESTRLSGKKRKRHDKIFKSDGLIISDDDILGWSKDRTDFRSHDVDENLAIKLGSSKSRKQKKNSWKKVGTKVDQQLEDLDTNEAEILIAQAAAENLAVQKEGEQEPILFDEGFAKVESGLNVNLYNVNEAPNHRQHEKPKLNEEDVSRAEKQSKKLEQGEETVYRDATGRRIDLVMRRQEARREAMLKSAKEREERDSLNGDFQRIERIEKRKKLDEIRFMPLTRQIDDKDLNDELKNKDRWNDPALNFISLKKKEKSMSGKPLYIGAAAPNRYGIRPGYRWDGVDRGNGWEAQKFKALNTATRNKELDYSWQMDE